MPGLLWGLNEFIHIRQLRESWHVVSTLQVSVIPAVFLRFLPFFGGGHCSRVNSPLPHPSLLSPANALGALRPRSLPNGPSSLCVVLEMLRDVNRRPA